MLPIIVEVQKLEFMQNGTIEPVLVFTGKKAKAGMAERYTVIIWHFPDRYDYREEETHKVVCY